MKLEKLYSSQALRPVRQAHEEHHEIVVCVNPLYLIGPHLRASAAKVCFLIGLLGAPVTFCPSSTVTAGGRFPRLRVVESVCFRMGLTCIANQTLRCQAWGERRKNFLLPRKGHFFGICLYYPFTALPFQYPGLFLPPSYSSVFSLLHSKCCSTKGIDLS